MLSNRYPVIAKEAWPILFILVFFYCVFHFYFDWPLESIWVALLIVVFCVCLYLFRDPTRIIPSMPLAIVSPVHGTVSSVEEVESPWLDRQAKRIRIKMSPLDIYSLRSPTEGKIIDQWSKAVQNGTHSREYAYWIKTDEDDDVVTALHLTKNKFFYRLYLQSGHRIGQGQRCGYLFFGSTVDVYVPANSQIKVKTGQHINSGSDVLALLVHTEKVSINDEKTNHLRKR